MGNKQNSSNKSYYELIQKEIKNSYDYIQTSEFNRRYSTQMNKFIEDKKKKKKKQIIEEDIIDWKLYLLNKLHTKEINTWKSSLYNYVINDFDIKHEEIYKLENKIFIQQFILLSFPQIHLGDKELKSGPILSLFSKEELKEYSEKSRKRSKKRRKKNFNKEDDRLTIGTVLEGEINIESKNLSDNKIKVEYNSYKIREHLNIIQRQLKERRHPINDIISKFREIYSIHIKNDLEALKIDKKMNEIEEKKHYIIKDIQTFIEINSKNIINDTNEDEPINDNDKNYTFNLFKKNFDNQNESIIKKLFFGIILNTTIAKCKCLEKNYSCESSKYIYLKYENIENYNKLSDVLENWGISQINQFHCQRCNLECEACENKTFVEYPQILIIILNDTKSEKKKSIKFPSILNVLKFSYKYKIKIVISSKNKDSNFNIILKNEKNNWIVCDKDSNEEKNINNLNGWIKFPRVLFYEKIEKTNNELQESETEENYNNFFENSQKTESIMMNTRIKNSMDYLKEDDSGFELFKNSSINNKTTKDKIQLNNNLSIDKNKNKNITKLIKKPIYFSSNLDEIENKMNSENVNNININKSKENNCNNKALADDNINQNQSKNNNNNIAKAKLLIEENKEINNSNTNSFMNINNNMNDNNNNYLNHIDDSFNNINKDFMDIMYGNFKDDIINNNMNNINNNNLYNINNNCIISNNLNNNTNNKNKYNNIINFNNLNNNNLNVNNNKNLIINNINNNNYQICSYNFNDIQPIFDYKIKGIVGFNRIKSYQMNLLNNNIFLNNNQKNNSQLTKKKNNKEIELVFILSTGRKCYITLDNDNITFGNAVKMLMEKYEWINVTNSGQIKFLYSGSIISDFNKTVKQYGFKDGNIIAIIFEN